MPISTSIPDFSLARLSTALVWTFHQIYPTLLLRRWLIVLLICYVGVCALIYRDFGVAIDEPLEYRFGEMLYARTFGHDPVLLHDFAYEKPDSREIWAYNHFHAMALFMINDSRSLDNYHLLNLLFGVVALWAAFEIAFLATKQSGWSVIAPVFLLLTPRFSGDLANNVKDPVFATYVLLSLLGMLWAQRCRFAIGRVLLVGIPLGLAAAGRTLGYSLLPIYVIYSLLINFREYRQTPKKLLLLVIEVGATAVVGIIIHGLQMPFVASDPVYHLPRLFQLAREYPWAGEMLYLGQMIQSTQLPWHYLLVWIGVTTPVVILGLWLFSHTLYRNKVMLLLLLSWWSELLLYYMIWPTIYDGLRHYLFLVVVMSVMAAIACIDVVSRLKSQSRRLVGLALLMVFLVLPTVFQYTQLHPYEYVYFNELVGFLPGAYGRFETDYWGKSYRESAESIINKAGHDVNQTVALCGNQDAASYFEGTGIKTIWVAGCQDINTINWDYAIAMGRNNEWSNIGGAVVFTASRSGIPLSQVFQQLH